MCSKLGKLKPQIFKHAKLLDFYTENHFTVIYVSSLFSVIDLHTTACFGHHTSQPSAKCDARFTTSSSHGSCKSFSRTPQPASDDLHYLQDDLQCFSDSSFTEKVVSNTTSTQTVVASKSAYNASHGVCQPVASTSQPASDNLHCLDDVRFLCDSSSTETVVSYPSIQAVKAWRYVAATISECVCQLVAITSQLASDECHHLDDVRCVDESLSTEKVVSYCMYPRI